MNNKSLLVLFFVVILAMLTVSISAAPPSHPVDEHHSVDEDNVDDVHNVDEHSVDDESKPDDKPPEKYASWFNDKYIPPKLREKVPGWVDKLPELVGSCWGWC